MGRKAQRRERRREAYHELREGHGPVSMDIRACLLVVHIVCCVTDIPGPHSTHAHQISSQGQNTCQVHNVTSTSHQSSCTRPWACGPSVRARAASLGSLPILMNPSFRAAIHPNPPPRGRLPKGKKFAAPRVGCCPGFRGQETPHSNCHAGPRPGSSLRLRRHSRAPWHVGAHDLSKIPQGPDAEGEFGKAR